MHRILFDQYDIEDQNHDFLTSKAVFQEALKEHLITRFLGIPHDPLKKLESADIDIYEFFVSADATKNLLTLKVSEEHFVHRLVKRELNLIYYPNLSLSTSMREVQLYSVSFLESKIEYDFDKIYYDLIKVLKRKKINFTFKNDFNSKLLYTYERIENFKDDAELEMYIDSNKTIEIAWKLISVLETDYFRNLESSDFQ